MWFPPYDINFTENTTATWETNNFIGRGEPLYTYNNTERTGTLSFKIIVDHPTYVNSFRGNGGPDDSYVASFFAGCVDPSQAFANRLTLSEISVLSQNVTQPQQKFDTPQTPPVSTISVYFPNDVYDSTLYPDYESSGNGIGTYSGQVTKNSNGNVGVTTYNDTTDYGLNGSNNQIQIDGVTYNGWSDPGLLPALNTYLNQKCPKCQLTVTGYASAQGVADANSTLAQNRAQNIYNILKANLFQGNSDISVGSSDFNSRFILSATNGVLQNGCKTPNVQTDNQTCKQARKVDITIAYNAALTPNTNNPDPSTPTQQQVNQQLNQNIQNRYYTESMFFDQLQTTDPFIFDKFRDKIRYFHPAFHSTTPEGLNSRLTFLQQCTRQGPTFEQQGGNNLAFGTPPVCILRIGDFYNTKIIIDNVGFDFELWDLNPEGIGVQPMIANVNLTFKFIGGSTLKSPINKLQNALSFNYYANAHVYDWRADYVAINPDTNTNNTNNANNNNSSNNTGNQTQISNYQIINGFNGNMNDPIKPTPNQVEANTPPINQGAASDANGNSPQLASATAPTTGSTTPQINGFTSIVATTQNTSTSGTWYFTVMLNTQNVQSLSYQDLDSFVSKGIKISFYSVPSASSGFEQVLTINDMNQNFSSGINFTQPSLPDGSYIMSVSYNGQKIASGSVILNGTNPNGQNYQTFSSYFS